jgi:putative membrane-bound dehydrogenase-like protein
MTVARQSGRLLTALAGFFLGLSAVSGAEPELRPEDLPHFPPVEPANVAASFEVRPGFHIEIAASEPEVVDPVAMSFDARGRAYVIEMRDYSERRPERLGRVRRLEDRDGDGRYETSTVFLDGLAWPTAITCWDDGVFVGTTPDILYAKDADGDGRADIRETVFTGFASDFAPYATNKLNVQAMMNSLQWGPDCRIHGCGSMSGGKIQRVISPFTTAWRSNALVRLGPAAAEYPETNAPLDLRGRDFSFDPRLLDLRLETGGGQYGMSFDDVGRKFFCSNSDHLQIARYEERYASRSGWFSPPSPRASIAADGPAAAVFRISPEEPWRVIRTRWRVTGLVEGLIEGGGRSSGYFTSATGITVYRGDAYGSDFSGDVFVADCGSNLIHRKKIRAQGCDLIGERPADERQREFLASRDTWFRPVQFANAPDGCLWIVDMYREVIEHPWSLPPNLKRLIDLNSGNDRGRLIRVVPNAKPLRRRVDLASASDEELIATLGHSNGWHRDTAARLLHERQGSTVPALKAALRKPADNPSAKLQALQLLFARKALDSMDLALSLRDASSEVRRAALRYTERTLRGNSLAPPIADRLAQLVTDDANVRLQLAFSLGTLPHPLRAQFLATLLRTATTNPGESLIAAAALSSLGDDVPVVFTILAREAGQGPSGSDVSLPALAEMIGRRNRPGEASAAIEQIAALPADTLALNTALQLANGLRGAGNSLAAADVQGRLKGLQTAALNAVTTGTGLPQVESIRLLGHFSGETLRPALLAALNQGRPASTQRAAIDVLLRSDDSTTLNGILERWGQLEPDAQTAFLETVLRRPSGTRAVLEAIGTRRLEVRSLTAAQVSALRGHADPIIQRRAIELLGPATANRHDAVAALLPALSLRGDIERGLAVHAAQCAPCHRLGGQGHALGPDLESVRSQPKEKLLVGILDPNREVQPTYLAVTVETTDGEALSGLLTSDTPAGITLVQAGGIQHQLARAKIQSVKPDGRSLMPEGFEATITAQQLADLLAALTGAP